MKEIYEGRLADAKKNLKHAVWFSRFDAVMAVLNLAVVVWQLTSGRPPFNAIVLLLMVAMWFLQQKTVRSCKITVARYERLVAFGV